MKMPACKLDQLMRAHFPQGSAVAWTYLLYNRIQSLPTFHSTHTLDLIVTFCPSFNFLSLLGHYSGPALVLLLWIWMNVICIFISLRIRSMHWWSSPVARHTVQHNTIQLAYLNHWEVYHLLLSGYFLQMPIRRHKCRFQGALLELI